jgi:hypothetical protein
MDKIILDQNGQGVLPYLPLNELRRAPQAGPQAQQGGNR